MLLPNSNFKFLKNVNAFDMSIWKIHLDGAVQYLIQIKLKKRINHKIFKCTNLLKVLLFGQFQG